MLVGLTTSGKTTCYQVLKSAMCALHDKEEQKIKEEAKGDSKKEKKDR